jgi:tRNA modification GTPase
MSSFNAELPVEELLITRQRHRENLQQCVDALKRFQGSLNIHIQYISWPILLFKDLQGDELVLAAEQLREAMRCIGRIVGQVDVEKILDIVFSDFCIGK